MVSSYRKTDEGVVFINGKYLKTQSAKISFLDSGFLYGDAAYDIGRTFKHRPYLWEDHLDRLFLSLRYIQLEPGFTPEDLYRIAEEVLERNMERLASNDEFMIAWRVSRGVGSGGSRAAGPTVIVHCYKIPFPSFAKRYVEGANIIIASTRRTPPQCLDPKAKLQNKLNHIVAERETAGIDPDAYVLMPDMEGRLAECAAHNVFIVRQNKILTPGRNNILEGIARKTVMELAGQMDIDCIETDLYPYDLYNADEIFVTSTSICLIPISKVNCRPINKQVPGPTSRRLLSAWSEKAGVDIVGLALSHLND